VDEVDLSIGESQIIALVGESGSGKSTLARLLALIYPPSAGEIYFHGTSIAELRSRQDLLHYRAQVPMVFQDPYSSLNPVFRVSHGVLRSLKLHRPGLSRQERVEEAERLFTTVGLSPAADLLRKFPHELSGGQRQRVGFAQALACRPQLILADEPVSMLDVSIRIGLLNLILELRQAQGVAFLYITHDIASARYVADRLVVMYAGQIVEQGPTEEVLRRPRHPYTQLLLAAVPDPRSEVKISAAPELGEPPRVIDPEEGCRFRFRCPLAETVCHEHTPKLRLLAPAHLAACHLAEEDRITRSPSRCRPQSDLRKRDGSVDG
jgi:peptide/nickel transport system ATP-binding protein